MLVIYVFVNEEGCLKTKRAYSNAESPVSIFVAISCTAKLNPAHEMMKLIFALIDADMTTNLL